MKHSMCWQIIVPRVLLVGVALLAVKYTASRVVCAVAVNSLQTAVGANVAANHARVSFLSGQFLMSDLRFSSRSLPAHTVLQVDRCALDFATASFLHKQAIVDYGSLTGLQFDLPMSTRPSPQTFPDASAAARFASAKSLQWMGNDSSEKARQWLATLDERFPQELIGQLASVARTEELCARWPTQAAQLDQRVRDLKRRAAELQQGITDSQQNPLRNVEFFNRIPEEAATLRAEFTQASAELERLVESVDAGRRNIALARRNDEQLVRKELQLEPIDGKSLTAYLLREQLRGPLDQVIAVLRWVRQEVPAQSVATRRRSRGEDLLFAGCTPTPSVLVRKLRLQGTACIGGQPIELRGTLCDLTDVPSFHPSPIRLRLRSAGAVPVEVQATVDRSRALAHDELLVDGRNILLPKLVLGHADEFRLALAPSVGTLSVSVQVEGERLSGDIQLLQNRVQMSPAFAGQLTDLPIVAALQETLSGVDSLAIRVSLSGTLSEPRGVLWSNVGSAVAEAMEVAARRTGDERAKNLLSRSQRRIDEQLAGLERTANDQQAALQTQMATATSALKRIAGEHAANVRISHGQVGRRLPTGSLFR